MIHTPAPWKRKYNRFIVLNAKGKLTLPFTNRDIRYNSTKNIILFSQSKPYLLENGVCKDFICHDENGQQFVVKIIKSFDPFDLGNPSYVFYEGRLTVTVINKGSTPNFWLDNFDKNQTILEMVLGIKFSKINNQLVKFAKKNREDVNSAYMDFQYEHCFKNSNDPFF